MMNKKQKVKIGIVGTGQRVCFHGGCAFLECRDDVQITGLCDIRPERVEHARKMYEKEFGYEIPIYTDYETMYDTGTLDGVYVAGPNYLHRDMTISALAHGLHVLCEKPMEITLKKCDEMILAAKKHKRLLGFAMQMRYRKRYHKVREIIDSGRLGKPVMVWCTEYRGPFMEMKDWVWEKKKSGGALVEKNCHHYDILNMWVPGRPTTVYASGNIMKHHRRFACRSEIVDNAWVVNDYSCGARGMVGICFLAGNMGHYRELGVQGTEGKIFFNLLDNETLHVEYTNGEREKYVINHDLRGGVFQDFVDGIRTNRPLLVTAKIAKDSLRIPLAAEKSLETKRIVNVSEIK